MIQSFSTLVECLRARAQDKNAGAADLRFFDPNTSDEPQWDYRELDRRARRIAAALQACNTKDPALLVFPPGLDYVAAFFGCLYAGIPAVPLYPPDPARLSRTLPRLQAVALDSKAQIVLTTEFILSMQTALLDEAPQLGSLTWLATDGMGDGEGEWKEPPLTTNNIAFLQYTSGSTSEPKGVVVTHANLLANLDMICNEAWRGSADSPSVSWLPPYHDMGLIGGILEPIFGGHPVTLMSPGTFLERPLRWLEAVSRTGAFLSGGPNFAYELCVRKTTPEERAALDLSHWEIAFCGAEPVRTETIERFSAAFESSGFRREAFWPCYGLAEASLYVSGGKKLTPPKSYSADASALSRDKVVPSAASERASKIVCVGASPKGQVIAVVDPETCAQRLPLEMGEVWVHGPNVAQGYWGKPELSRTTFDAHILNRPERAFMRTGDLGFMLENGELFITGRLKDIIVVGGLKHHPSDIERTIEQSHPAFRAGGSAAFGIEKDGQERLVVVAEVDRKALESGDALTLTLPAINEGARRTVAEKHELPLFDLLLLRPGSLPKTSSGKVQRYICRERYLTHAFERVGKYEA